MWDDLPLSPWVYELGNSLISSLSICLLVILARFFATEAYRDGVRATYARGRVKFALGVSAFLVGGASYRMWTWWGRYCANMDSDCSWMLRQAWPVVPVFGIAVEIIGLLCMIRMLVPGVWGRWAWVISAMISVSWSMFWFSGWQEIMEMLR